MIEDELTPQPETDPPEPASDSDAEAAELRSDAAQVSVEAEAVVETDMDAPPVIDEWLLGDIDAALAAVESLSIMPEREAEAEARADARHSAPTFVPEMRLPPMTTLKRGQLGSVVPALLLIGFGAWLTLTTTSGTPPDPLLIAAVIVGGIVLTLLAQWLGTGRWSRGVLFFALAIVLIIGVGVFSVQPNGIDPTRSYPLLIAAFGLALTLTGVLARPFRPRLITPGLLLVLAGALGLVVTLGYVPGDWLTFATPLAPILLVVVLILWLLPLIFRRQKR